MQDEEEESSLVDISAYIDQCASSLTVQDPLLFANSFSLYESMAALELMHPSMDSCCESSTTTTTTTSTILPYYSLSFEQVCGISLEATIIRVVSYLEGSSVAESIYTCLYVQKHIFKQLLQQQTTTTTTTTQTSSHSPQFCLFAILLGMLTVSDCIRSIVDRADIYEEEDFNLNSFGFTFQRDTHSHEDVCQILSQAHQNLQCLLNHTDTNNTTTSPSLFSSMLILSHILSFQLHFIQCCQSLLNISTSTYKETNVTSPTLQFHCQQAYQFAKQCQHALQQLKESFQLYPQNIISSTLLATCFDFNINHPLMGNTPLRKISNYKGSVEEAIAVLISICFDLADIGCGVGIRIMTDNTPSFVHQNLQRTQSTLKRISSSRNCNILVRSVLALNLYFDEKIHGQYNLSNWIHNSIMCYSCPKLVIHPQEKEKKNDTIELSNTFDYGAAFLLRLEKPIYDSCKLLLLNRSRQRTLLSEHYFKEWSLLQTEANALDFYFTTTSSPHDELSSNGRSITHWVLLQTLLVMEHYIDLSIDTGLVHEHQDLVLAYWYLSFLYSAHLNVLNTLLLTQPTITNTSMEESISSTTNTFRGSSSSNNNNNIHVANSNNKKKDVKSSNRVKMKQEGYSTASNSNKGISIAEINIENNLETLLVGVSRFVSKGIFQVKKNNSCYFYLLLLGLFSVQGHCSI